MSVLGVVEVEREAARRRRTLLTFDTITGGPAERMYLARGCVKVGEIPGYALLPEGGAPVATSVFYKPVSPPPATDPVAASAE